MKIIRPLIGSIDKYQRLTENWTKFDVCQYNPSSSKPKDWNCNFKISYSDIDNCRIIRTTVLNVCNKVEIIPKGDISLSKFIITINL